LGRGVKSQLMHEIKEGGKIWRGHTAPEENWIGGCQERSYWGLYQNNRKREEWGVGDLQKKKSKIPAHDHAGRSGRRITRQDEHQFTYHAVGNGTMA